MSEELQDEVEAINSIFGAGSLVQAGEESDIYVLSLPEETVSLRLQFPPDYPAVPPSVLSTNSSGGRRGLGARDLELFRGALGNIYQPGFVCLFDAIEELKRLQEEAGLNREPSLEPKGTETDKEVAARQNGSTCSSHASGLGPEPPWVESDPFVELKSTFVARCAAVTSPDQADQYVQHLLASKKRIRDATHNITAWRIRGPNGTSFQDCDDDGETAAGGRLLHLLQLMDLWDTMVIVTRWYGGQKLGPRRFALINSAARDAFVKAGLVDDSAGSKKKHSAK
ncbi:ribosomal protein S5 domain 2-type protein [Coniella lustricola]|uniref:Ribosomal protein S5 domain 2-type protein n=1 Tax=Coniella lustricola TaxID=2025994 RepID=A0A2T3AC50_9PEZI|nr:ribosomal protein S5 domain 2-type protein [Coniella lustricola]